MTRSILAVLVLAISIPPLYAQNTTLHTDRSGYTTGIDGNRTVNTYTEQANKKKDYCDATKSNETGTDKFNCIKVGGHGFELCRRLGDFCSLLEQLLF